MYRASKILEVCEMRERIALALVLTGLFAWATGCRQEIDRTALESAINKSFAGRHECVWAEPIKLPAEVDPSKDERIRDFDALTDVGLLTREVEEKSHALVGTHQMDKFSLSGRGQSAWAPDPSRPGYGNFCVGHFNVTAIDKATPNDRSNPTQYMVNYSYEVEGIPAWAQTPESMRAFRKIAADTSIQSATATVLKGSDGSWEVISSQAAH
jgi:hypothetical protein